jgi:hypothetical protein
MSTESYLLGREVPGAGDGEDCSPPAIAKIKNVSLPPPLPVTYAWHVA